MLDIKFIRDNPDLIKKNCKDRRATVDVDKLLELDEARRKQQSKIDELRAQRKKGSKGKPSAEDIQKMRALGDDIAKAEAELAGTEENLRNIMLKVPNLTHPDAPTGGEEDFKVLEICGKVPEFDFPPADHEKLMSDLDMLDFERGAKVATSKFYFLKNDAVLLEQALVEYGLKTLRSRGFTLVQTPDLAKDGILQGIGFSPRGPETQVYSLENWDLSLIGTAEITMGGYHSGEVLDLSKGPLKYAALSHCFRTEAGSYGRTSKGLYRVHQFTKLEMFVYCKPEESELLHQELLSLEKQICDGLGLAYRVIDTASADLGGPAYRKYDIEAWMTMKGEKGKAGDYGEITSTSNCTDYQARRLNIKYRKDDGTTEFVHTLNGTAVVLSRFPIVIVEQFQQKDGSIEIPPALQKYIGKKTISK